MKELIISEFGIKLRKRSGRIQVWGQAPCNTVNYVDTSDKDKIIVIKQGKNIAEKIDSFLNKFGLKFLFYDVKLINYLVKQGLGGWVDSLEEVKCQECGADLELGH